MDWSYSLFAAEQGLLGIVPLLVALLALFAAASPGRKVVACSPSLVALETFAIFCIVAGLPGVEDWPLVDYLTLLGLLLTVVLFVPSTLSLKHRWHGVVHLLTHAGA